MSFPLDINDPFPGIKLIITLIIRNLSYIRFCKENVDFHSGISGSSADNSKLTPDFLSLKTNLLIKILFRQDWLFKEEFQFDTRTSHSDEIRPSQDLLEFLNHFGIEFKLLIESQSEIKNQLNKLIELLRESLERFVIIRDKYRGIINKKIMTYSEYLESSTEEEIFMKSIGQILDKIINIYKSEFDWKPPNKDKPKEPDYAISSKITRPKIYSAPNSVRAYSIITKSTQISAPERIEVDETEPTYQNLNLISSQENPRVIQYEDALLLQPR